MNVIKELLERSKYGDGIKPEYNQQVMAEIIISLPPMVFDKLTAQMNNAALVKDLMSENRVDLKSVA